MRRDLVYYFERPVNDVYNAFVQAANQRFGKNCVLNPPKKLSFGLNYSFKYNMNGGSVTAHFMPYNNGTAVDLRYTIVQAFGARYKAHAQDLTVYAGQLLNIPGRLIQLDINVFLAYEESDALPPEQPNQPVMPAQPELSAKTCPKCGKGSSADAKFCTGCGYKFDAAPRFCHKCGAPLEANAQFCSSCGNKII